MGGRVTLVQLLAEATEEDLAAMRALLREPAEASESKAPTGSRQFSGMAVPPPGTVRLVG